MAIVHTFAEWQDLSALVCNEGRGTHDVKALVTRSIASK